LQAAPGETLAALEGEDKSVNRDGLSESHSDNAQSQNLAGSIGVASNGFYGFSADHSDADSSCRTSDGEGKATCDSSGCSSRFCDELWYHFIGFSYLFFSPTPAVFATVPSEKAL
jgi:hypothetical protein